MKNVTSKLLLIISLILAFLLFRECEKNNDDYQKPEGLISVEQATDYEKNYIDNQFKYINESINGKKTDNDGVLNEIKTNYKDSRAFRFTIKKLEDYIHYVKEHAKSNDLEGELSLRIYLGAKKTKFGGEEESIMRTRVFIIPTHKEITRNKEEPHKTIDGIGPLNYGGVGDPKNIPYRIGE